MLLLSRQLFFIFSLAANDNSSLPSEPTANALDYSSWAINYARGALHETVPMPLVNSARETSIAPAPGPILAALYSNCSYLSAFK